MDFAPFAIGLFVPLGAFALVAWVVYVVVEGRRRREQHRVELHSRLLERIGSAREFGEFLSTDAGARFLDSLSPERPHHRIVSSAKAGVFFTVFGAIVLAAAKGGMLASEGEDVALLGTILLGVGVALIVAALVSYSLSKKLGLLRADEERMAKDVTSAT